MLADTTDDSLEDFFSRPIKIKSYDWGTGTNLFETFNPWKDFWENPRVINRVTNYNLLRCKMCVKFVINGNGFYYGRAIASYLPLHTADTFTKDRSFFIEDVVAASQRPHIYLDPTNSQGGSMCLPFIWPKNALDIPEAEWDDMGDIIIHGMQNLKHANDASGSVTVSVFAWAEDVHLSIPTANEPGALSPQAGELYVPQAGDEYGEGMISRPANAVAQAMGALSAIPSIAPYARATEIAANAVSRVASAFGFSRPTSMEEIAPYKPTFVGNMANANVSDTSNKLTFDVKQELTVDTRTMGLDGTDEMTIKSLGARESFLTQFSWPVAAATETLLWNSEVNPVIWNELNQAGRIEYHMPACCFAALPFRSWRGTMKFRFQIVCSAFHKGRLKIVYDPSFPLTNEYNTNYTRIVDLAEEKDLTVEVGWGQQTPFLDHRDMINGSGEIFDTAKLSGDPASFANGILSVYVVNDLTVPNSIADNDIEINVFVSMADDFEVINPDERYISELSWFQPQLVRPQAGELDCGGVFSTPIAEVEVQTNSKCVCCRGSETDVITGKYEPQAGEDGINVPDADATTEENAPMQATVDESLAVTHLDTTDNTMSVFYGDPVTSIRQVLKRYNYSRSYIPPDTADAAMVLWRLTLNNLPLYRGYAPDGIDDATGAINYNFNKVTAFNYFLPAYTCWRGGIRWKYFLNTDIPNRSNAMTVTRDTSPTTSYSNNTAILPSYDSVSQSTAAEFLTRLQPSLHDGGYVTPAGFNPVVEAEIPYHTNTRFSYGKQSTLNLNLGVDSEFHNVSSIFRSVGGGVTFLNAYQSVGEDFTLGFFTGAPVAYYQPTVVPA